MTEKKRHWDAVLEVKSTGGPAFPIQVAEHNVYTGMTLRDYFAAKAMTGMLAASENYTTYELCEYAYAVADAMLKERLK